MLNRRDFVSSLVGLSAAPSFAQAQARVPVVGFLSFASEQSDLPKLEPFRLGLKEQGLVEGDTVRVVARHSAGDPELGARYIEELIRLPVDVFVTPGPGATRAIKNRTNINVVGVGLPPKDDGGLFISIARPGGTVTGFSNYGEELSAKRYEILLELLPTLQRIGVLHTINDPSFRDWGAQTKAYIESQGLKASDLGLETGSREEITRKFQMLKASGGTAVMVVRDFLTSTVKDEIVRSAFENGLVVAADESIFPKSGAVFSYGADLPDLFRRAAGYVDRIIKGQSASDLPIQLPTKFEFVLNVRAARALNISVPPTLLLRVDELIE